jgi:class 3 adenylate cyclase/tetratricopeptide (TPR) repeat protein
VPICRVCGEENPERARFCLACGEALPEQPAERFRRVVTILFSDVVDSTGLGERLDPETLDQVMTAFFEGVGPVVERHGGKLAKFIGDAVMAVFGLTELHEDDALRAVRAAVEMRHTLARLNDDFQRRYGVTLATRTGLNTGTVAGKGLVPDRNFVAGDAANAAARLQQHAEAGEILLAESTYRLVRDAIDAEPLAPLELKGKRDAIGAYRLLALREGPDAASRLDAPLVGRRDALAQLEWVLERAEAERDCRLVTVVGGPGIGKSRLTHEFVESLDGRATVLRGRCLPYGEGITFWPLAQMVRQAAGIQEDEGPGESVARIEALLPPDDDAHSIAETIAHITGLKETTGVVAEGFWAVRRLFATLAAERPLVVLLDDAHWAEATLLELIENLARHSESVPIVLLCASRPELLERLPEWGHSAGAGPSTVVRLEPLDDAACDRLIAELLGETQSLPEVRDHVAGRAEGNPLFIEQLISMLIDDGKLESLDGRWVAVGDLDNVTVPPGIHALLAARLELLGSDERALLGRAAVMGQTFYVGAVADLSSPDLAVRIPSLLLELVRKELIRPSRSDFRDEEAFEFRHLLIRDAAYDAVTKESRADLHARFADWLERTAGERLAEYAEIVGWHLEQAHRYLAELGPIDERGAELARRAADRLAGAGWTASSRGDTSAGVKLRSRALALMAPDDPRRPQLLGDLGDALLWAGQFEDADRALAEAIELADRAGDERTRIRSYLSQLRLRFQVDPDVDYAELEAEGLAMAARCEANGDDFSAARAWRLVSWARYGLCQLEGMREPAERAYEFDSRAKDPHYPHDDLVGIIVALSFGPTPASRALVEGSEVLERVRGHRGAEAYALCFLGQLRGMLGERDAAREMILKGVADRQVLGDLPGAAMSRGEGLGYFIEMVRGDWPAAERELRRAYDELSSMGDKSYLSLTAGWLARCLYALGRYEEADELATTSELATARSWIAAQVTWRGVRALLLAQRGDVEAGERLAREAVELALRTDRTDTQTSALMDLVEVLLVAGRREEAIPIVIDALERYERKEVLPAAARARALLDELTAGTAASVGS